MLTELFTFLKQSNLKMFVCCHKTTIVSECCDVRMNPLNRVFTAFVANLETKFRIKLLFNYGEFLSKKTVNDE